MTDIWKKYNYYNLQIKELRPGEVKSLPPDLQAAVPTSLNQILSRSDSRAQLYLLHYTTSL